MKAFDHSSIYTLTPLNGTAATVTSQANCENPDNETLEQTKDRLTAELNWLKDANERAKAAKNFKKKKDLGCQILNKQSELNKLKNSIKSANPGGENLENFIIKICKEKFNKWEWNGILRLAREAKEENDKSLNGKSARPTTTKSAKK